MLNGQNKTLKSHTHEIVTKKINYLLAKIMIEYHTDTNFQKTSSNSMVKFSDVFDVYENGH